MNFNKIVAPVHMVYTIGVATRNFLRACSSDPEVMITYENEQTWVVQDTNAEARGCQCQKKIDHRLDVSKHISWSFIVQKMECKFRIVAERCTYSGMPVAMLFMIFNW